MVRSASKRVLQVCLFSSHTLVVREVQAHLAPAQFKLKLRPMPAAAPLPPSSLPAAQVYVLDVYQDGAMVETLIAQITARFPNASIVAISESFVETNSFPLLRQGVKGLLEYSAIKAQQARALHTVAEGRFWVSRSLLSGFVDTLLSTGGAIQCSTPRPISRREKEILNALLENLSNKEIAYRYNISERTAKFHVSNLLAKFGVQRRADLILLNLQSARKGAETVQ